MASPWIWLKTMTSTCSSVFCSSYILKFLLIKLFYVSCTEDVHTVNFPEHYFNKVMTYFHLIYLLINPHIVCDPYSVSSGLLCDLERLSHLQLRRLVKIFVCVNMELASCNSVSGQLLGNYFIFIRLLPFFYTTQPPVQWVRGLPRG
jgi:hypothetical protein